MKRMLSFKNLLFATLAAFTVSSSEAQTITTAYTNNPGRTIWVHPSSVTFLPYYVTFNIANNNCYPITLTDLSTYHQATGVISSNGAVYTLLYTSSNLPPQFPSLPTGYNVIGSSIPITTGANAITPILSGLNFTIPANTTYRMALYATDTIVVAGTAPPNPQIIPSPGSFTTAGVTLTSIGAPLSSTAFVIIGNSSSPPDATGFEGSITFKPSGPALTALNNNTCIGDSITLSATVPACIPPGATVQWNGPAGTFNGPVWKIVASAANAGVYTATFTSNGNTSAITSITVTVTAPPPPPIINGKRAYCVNEQFEPLTTTGTNILWYINPTGGTGTTLPPYVNTTVPGSYTWYATQTTDITNCESIQRTKVTITVAPKPTPPTVVSPIGYCELSPADSLKAGGQNLKWYVTPFGGLGSIFAPTPNTSVKDTLTWYVSQTLDGCESQRSKIDVVVTFRPNGMVVVSRDPEICAGDTLSFFYYGSGTPTTAYGWAVPKKGATIVAGANGPGPFVVRFDTAGIQQVTLLPTNLGCNGEMYVQDIEVKPIPTAAIDAPQNICKNEVGMIKLYSFTSDIDTFTWGWDGGKLANFSTDQGPYGVSWSTGGRKILSLRVTRRECSGFASDTLIVRELPDARIMGYDGKEICQSDSILLQAGTIVPSSQYQWSPARFFDEYSTLPVTNARVDFNDKIKLDVTDEFGCKNADSISFKTKPCCEVVFPTAFTPNGDGKNDYFHPIYIGSGASHQNEGDKQLSTLRVVNRWGQAVFESANSNTGWDGNINGKPQDMGTYYYYIQYRCNGKPAEQKGEILLVR